MFARLLNARLLLAAMLGFCGAAHGAGTDGFSVLQPPSLAHCLSRPAGDSPEPSYPASEMERKMGATVRARMTFGSADKAPKVDIFYNSSTSGFSDSVTEFVAAYRMPCWTERDGPQVLTQEFAFDPLGGHRVALSPARGDGRARRGASCFTTGSEKPLAQRTSATVLVQMKFVHPEQAPEVKVLYNSGRDWHVATVLEAIAQYRDTCMDRTGPPMIAQQIFRFQPPREQVLVLQDMGLRQLLGIAANADAKPVRFDTQTMGCPFDIRFAAYQPYAANSVDELERADPNRREFVEWLRGLRLKLPDKTVPHVMGQPIVVSVPCVVLDLS